MEYTPDVAAEWPNFADRPIRDAAALHVTDRELEGGAWRMLRAGILGGKRRFAVFLASETDTSLHRARSFWKQHPDLAALGDTWEQSHASDHIITRVALLELQDSKDIRNALFAIADQSQRRALVMTGESFDADVFARALVADPALSRAHFQPRGLVPWLLRAGLSLGALILRAEDSLDGSPGLGVYGSGEQIRRLRDALVSIV